MSKQRVKRIIFITLIILIVAFLGITYYYLLSMDKLQQISKMNYQEMLEFTLEDNEDGHITVGIVESDNITFTVYGEDGTILPHEEHIYEIGSITKTFTTSLLAKAIADAEINLDNSIDEYLELPEKEYYPTIRRLVTHTSGYNEFYFETPMIFNFLTGKNDFNGITKDMLINKIGEVNLDDIDYPFLYSNFGIAVIGLVLEEIYDEDFSTLMNAFASEELALLNTIIFSSSDNLDNAWEWSESDAYLPTGALVSNISDMLKYAQMQLLDVTHETLATVDANSDAALNLGIRIDAIGMGWMIDRENNIIWHNGATDNYNSYIGLDKEKQVAVVVLSNLSPNYRASATFIGINLLKSLQVQN